MPRTLTPAVLAIFACAVTACASSGENESPPDLSSIHGDGGIDLGTPSSSPDGGKKKSGDAAAPPPVEITIHDVDTGLVTNGTMVRVQTATLVGPVRSAGVDAEDECTFDAYVVDPTNQAPAGIRVFVDVLACPGGNCACPTVGSITTLLDAMTTPSDTFDLTGAVETYSYDGGPLEHGIFVTKLARTGTGSAIAPTLVADAPTLATFLAGGPGFAANEGMLVTIAPAGGLTATAGANATFVAGGITFGSGYLAAVDAGAFPQSGSTWTRITGVVWTAHGGVVAPRSASDFVP